MLRMVAEAPPLSIVQEMAASVSPPAALPPGRPKMIHTRQLRDLITLGGDLQVVRIGYGAMRLTGPNLWGEYPDHDGGIALLRQAVEAGVTLIDTADMYGPHSNELLIREALYPYPGHL